MAHEIDLSALTDADLDALRVDVLNEQERRDRLASTPATVAQIAARFTEDGGDKADLIAAIETV